MGSQPDSDQVVTNLVSNALKYGAGKPVKVRIEPAGHLVRIVVHDQGIGIAAGDHERIFERFDERRPATSVASASGSWITRQILELHGGRVFVESALGQGSSFIVELPLVPASGAERSGRPHPRCRAPLSSVGAPS